jgi:hypothetical protein
MRLRACLWCCLLGCTTTPPIDPVDDAGSGTDACVPDCRGICGGDAVVDCAGTCGGDAVVDCSGVCGGDAVVDCSGVCGGDAQRDCAGVCEGDAEPDCRGICNGPHVVDCLGECGGRAVVDCEGTCGGTARVDCAGVCNGGALMDCSGVCGGEDVGTPAFADADGDGLGDSTMPMYACGHGDGAVLVGGDCDDTNARCGTDCTDADGDGWCVGVDCDDAVYGCNADCGACVSDGTIVERRVFRGRSDFGLPYDIPIEAIASIGDVDGNGFDDVAFGTPAAGRVDLLLVGPDFDVVGVRTLHSPLASIRYGHALAALPDLDGNGAPELLVGSPASFEGGVERGKVWIHFLDQSGQVLRSLELGDRTGGFGGGLRDGDRFGSSAAMLGDLDGDGAVEVAVGAPGDASSTGAVWILSLSSAGLRGYVRLDLDALELQPSDEAGAALAFLGDVDGDGFGDLAIGTPGRDVEATPDVGAIRVVRLNRRGESVGGGRSEHVESSRTRRGRALRSCALGVAIDRWTPRGGSGRGLGHLGEARVARRVRGASGQAFGAAELGVEREGGRDECLGRPGW